MGAERPGQAKALAHFQQTARRQGSEGLEIQRVLITFYRQAKFAIRRDRPEIGRPLGKVELVARMVLREAAIRVRVRSAARAGAQIGDQLFEFEPAAFYLYRNENFVRVQSHQEIETIGGRAMFRAAWLEKKMPFQPAPLQNQLAGRRELADVFAHKAERFAGKKPVVRRWFVPVGVGFQHFARDAVLRIDRKQTGGEAGEKIFRLPIRQGRANPKAGNRRALSRCLTCRDKFVLQPRFQFGFQIRIKQIPNISPLPLADGWPLFPLQ